jgi:hypothetical protein
MDFTKKFQKLPRSFVVLSRNALNTYRAGNTCCRTGKLQKHEYKVLYKVAGAAFAAVVLQVTVHHKADDGIKGQVGGHAGVAVGVKG